MRDKKPRPPDDELTRKLREAARAKPPLSLLGLLIMFFFCGGPVAIFVWWIFPRPTPPAIALVAFDDVAAAGNKVTMRARVVANDTKQPLLDYGGLELLFAESQAGKALKHITAAIDDRGQVAVTTALAAKSGAVQCLVRYPGTRYTPSYDDKAEIFLWPKNAAPLLVAVETLANADDRRRNDAQQVLPLEGASECLHLASKDRPIAYLALADAPWIYLRMRAGLKLQFTKKTLPKGPVLGRMTYAKGSTGGVAPIAARMSKEFTGKTAVVVGTPEVARALRDLKVHTFLLGAAQPVEGVPVASSWKELGALLSKKH